MPRTLKALTSAILGLYGFGAIAIGGQCLWLERSAEYQDSLRCANSGLIWPLIAYEVFVVQERCDADLENIKPCP